MNQESMWTRVMLSGPELDAAVNRVLGLPENTHYKPSTAWEYGGPLIESNQVFIDPPHDVHMNPGGNVRYEQWTATVSARVRKYDLPGDSPLVHGRVGRGAGKTPLIAAMRAIVASFGEEHHG